MNTEIFKNKLLEEKEKLTQKIAFYRGEDPVMTQDRKSSYSFDDDTAEDEGHDRIQATAVEAEEFIKDIDQALQKIEDGSYGQCENCHQDIPEERLEVYPAAKYCIKCESQK